MQNNLVDEFLGLDEVDENNQSIVNQEQDQYNLIEP